MTNQHPCLCDVCLSARDAEIARVRTHTLAGAGSVETKLTEAAWILEKHPCEVYGLQQTCEEASFLIAALAQENAAQRERIAEYEIVLRPLSGWSKIFAERKTDEGDHVTISLTVKELHCAHAALEGKK